MDKKEVRRHRWAVRTQKHLLSPYAKAGLKRLRGNLVIQKKRVYTAKDVTTIGLVKLTLKMKPNVPTFGFSKELVGDVIRAKRRGLVTWEKARTTHGANPTISVTGLKLTPRGEALLKQGGAGVLLR